MYNMKLSEMPENTMIQSTKEDHGTVYLRATANNADRTPYWHALFTHCVDCAETDNLTLEQADRDLTAYKMLALPYGVAVQMAITLQDEYGNVDGEGEDITVSGLIIDAVESHKAAIERNAKYKVEGI